MEGIMNVESILTTSTGTMPTSTLSKGAEEVKKARESAKDSPQVNQEKLAKKNEVQQEELLQNIKALTQDGLYSVRFEMHKETNDIVINLIEQDTGEIIRQIPSEEILGLKQTLEDLRGNLVEIDG